MNIFSGLSSFFNANGLKPICKTAFSSKPSLDNAVKDISSKLKNPSSSNLALVFISSHFASDFPRLLPLLKKRIKAEIWLGCATCSVFFIKDEGIMDENQNSPSLSVTLLTLPQTKLIPFHIPEKSKFDLDNPSKVWTENTDNNIISATSGLIFIDPSTEMINDLISSFDFVFPKCNLIGGIGSHHSSSHGSLFFDDKVCKGSVGILMEGDWRLETLVTKGVKPIGPILEVESVKKNILLKLRDKENNLLSPIEFLHKLIDTLSENDRDLLQKSLFLGVENKSMKISSKGELSSDGTFVVRDLLGIDPVNGSVAVSDFLKVGQKVQFQARDGEISQEEIEIGLKKILNKIPDRPLLGILLSCFSRCNMLDGSENSDLDYAKIFLKSMPFCGGFLQGEIGQINGNTHLHGYSACWGLLVKNPTEK